MTSHVKIYGITPRIQYTADGSLTTFEFPFAIFSSSDINVYLDDELQADTAYTVTGAQTSDGGSVTFETAPTSGTIITLIRNLSIERTTDFQEGGALRADTLNDELDYQIACQQQIAENLNRSMVLPPYATDTDVDLTLPTPSAGKAIVWNADGTNLENSTVAVNALESTLKGYKTSAETAATTATTKAGIASDKADIATTKAQLASDKADIASAKATEAATTLASKASTDMDNLTTTGKEKVVALGMPDYSAGTSISLTDTTWKEWSAPCDCYIIVVAHNQGGTLRAQISEQISSVNLLSDFEAGLVPGYSMYATATAFIPKGKTVYLRYTGTLDRAAYFPLKGVQNA